VSEEADIDSGARGNVRDEVSKPATGFARVRRITNGAPYLRRVFACGEETTMKNVLLMTHIDAGQEARLQAALDLTRALGGHLTCIEVFVPPTLAEEMDRGDASVGAVAAGHTSEYMRAALLRERLSVQDVPWDWLGATSGPAEQIAAEAGLADVIVSSRQADRLFDPNLPRVTADVALANAQPVVAVPADSKGIDWQGRALVAWDGSPACMAVLRNSTPILTLASDVEILEIDDRLSGPSAEAAARYLSRYDVASTVHRIHSLIRPTAELIEGRADVMGADYIVMGAYGHNRMRELFFGGVTRSMIRDSRHPLVLAH